MPTPNQNAAVKPEPYAEWWAEWGDVTKASNYRLRSMIFDLFEAYMFVEESQLADRKILKTYPVPLGAERDFGLMQMYDNGYFAIYAWDESGRHIALLDSVQPHLHFSGQVLRYLLPNKILDRYLRTTAHNFSSQEA